MHSELDAITSPAPFGPAVTEQPIREQPPVERVVGERRADALRPETDAPGRPRARRVTCPHTRPRWVRMRQRPPSVRAAQLHRHPRQRCVVFVAHVAQQPAHNCSRGIPHGRKGQTYQYGTHNARGRCVRYVRHCPNGESACSVWLSGCAVAPGHRACPGQPSRTHASVARGCRSHLRSPKSCPGMGCLPRFRTLSRFRRTRSDRTRTMPVRSLTRKSPR
jgi:hypothetical protein